MRFFKILQMGCGALGALGALGCSGGDEPVTLDWRAAWFDASSFEWDAVAGATVCVDDHPEVDCQQTDAEGIFTLTNLPADSDVVLTLTKRGYLPTVKLIHTQSVDASVPQALVVLRESDLPAGLDGTKGVIGFFVFDFPPGSGTPKNLPGVKVWLSPETEAKPIYQVEGEYDSSLTATPEIPDDANSVGLFTGGKYLDVPPGEYELHFTPPDGYKCQSIGVNWSGIPVPGEEAVRVIVRAGYYTADVGMNCTR